MSYIPFKPTDILIPKNVDMSRWSVVACDQYTSEPEYWQKVKDYICDHVSTLNLIFPEVYLNDGDGEQRIKKINEAMKLFCDANIFDTYSDSMIYVEREVAGGKIRHGIVGAVDLEHYDYHKGSKSLIRATEETVIERIPPRVKIRKNASLELPHIMLLIDDEDNLVFNGIDVSNAKKVYDFDLMMSSGHICGYSVDTAPILEGLNKLYNRADSNNRLLFAVGDGNHSLATAKECWEQFKADLSEDEKANHPARFALVEIVNIHDSSLEFEPIHRVVFDCDTEDLLNSLKTYYPGANSDGNGQKITYICEKNRGDIYIPDGKSELTVGTLQIFLDTYLTNNNGRIDYIHGEDVAVSLAKQDNAIGFLLPPMEKSQLFKTVISDGALPRKTFSMGEAWEKRFYLECRKVK